MKQCRSARCSRARGHGAFIFFAEEPPAGPIGMARFESMAQK
jgi:hypothetical protein